jgi:hypothetical protein
MERYCKGCDKRKGIKNGKYRIIYEVGDAPCRACPIDDMKDELDNAPTIEPEPHWIPCSERLPEGNLYVLVTYKYQYGLMDIGITWYSERENKWCDARPIIAWMPLPERYGGEQDG